MNANLKNPLLVSKVSLEDLSLVDEACKILRLHRADFIRLVVMRETQQIVNEVTRPNGLSHQ